MALSGPSSYLPTVDEFIAHWNLADAALGAAGPLSVLGGQNVSWLGTLRTQLEGARAEVEALRNDREGARFTLDSLKAALLARLNQFNSRIRAEAPETKWEAMLPRAYSTGEGMGKVVPPLDDVRAVWEDYEAGLGNIVLMGGYTFAMFQTQLAALKSAYTELSAADNSTLSFKRKALACRLISCQKWLRDA